MGFRRHCGLIAEVVNICASPVMLHHLNTYLFLFPSVSNLELSPILGAYARLDAHCERTILTVRQTMVR